MVCGALLFILSGFRLHAQENGNKTYEVRGAVINSVTHEPIARALVTIAGETTSSQLTDNEGRFDFPNIPAGRSVLQAKRPGFFGTGLNHDLYQPIAVGPSAPEHVLTLEPAGTITGHITLSTSDAESDIRVQLMRRTLQEGRASWQPFAVKAINTEGMFRFGNLQPGEYRLRTIDSIDPDPATSQAPVRWGFPALSYPEESESNSAGSLKIRPGQEQNVELALTRQPFYSVTIPVTNQPSLLGYSVRISGHGHADDAPTIFDSRQQQFRAWLPNGNYTITLQSFTSQPGFASDPITVRNAPVQTQSLTVLPLHPISVAIRKEFTAATNGGGPQIIQIENGKQVELSRDVNLTLFSTDNEQPIGGSLLHEPGGDDASWLLENVLPGKYWVQAYANQGYVASITAGGTDLARDPLVVGPGGSSVPIDIVLRNDTATLSVHVKNAPSAPLEAEASTEPFVIQPQAQSPLGFLYLVPQFDTSSIVQQSVPLQQTTTIPNLFPGTYHVLAFDRPFDLEYRNPKALEKYAGKGQTVTLEPNGTANIDVEIQSADAAAQ